MGADTPREGRCPLRLLLVEDDADLANWLSQSLVRRGFVVEWAEDGHVADLRLRAEEFDAILLDIGLPSLSGEQLLVRLRGAGNDTPILVMTARDSLSRRVTLLQEGADDFMAKPVAVEELEARLQALIRRSHGRARGVYHCGPLSFDQGQQRFALAGEVLALSPREHAVLRLLIQRAGEPMSKQQILDRMVSTESDLNPEAIEVIIHRLRRKLGEGPVQIVTLRGLGYLLETAGDGA